MTMKLLPTPLFLAIALIVGMSSSDAQQPGKVFRIGVLALPPANTMQHRLGVFRETLRDLGYEEGRNLIVESRFAYGAYDRLPILASELARLKVDHPGGTGAARGEREGREYSDRRSHLRSA
jgi:hypothetical protein